MKTVFRKGMKVYDSVFFPKSEGKVVDIEKQIDCERVIVQFDCLDYELSYTEQGKLTSTRNEAAPTLSTSPYTFQGFEQKAPVPTFEEAWNNSHNSKEIFYSSNCDKVCSGYPTQELADASEALRRLLFLRDYYNDGWQPDWSTVTWKYFILVRRVYPIVEFEVDCAAGIPHVLSFKTRDIAKKILEEQRELLEIAKPLL